MWPRSDLARLAVAMAVVVAVVAVAAPIVVAWSSLASVSFPRDGGGGAVWVDASSVYQSVLDVAAPTAPEGARHRCGRVAGHRQVYGCRLPGRGDGDLRYRVVVETASSCWHARRVGFPPLHGCLPTQAASAD